MCCDKVGAVKKCGSGHLRHGREPPLAALLITPSMVQVCVCVYPCESVRFVRFGAIWITGVAM